MFRQMFLCRWVIEVLKILRDQDKDICAKCGRVKVILPHHTFDPAKAYCFTCRLRSEE